MRGGNYAESHIFRTLPPRKGNSSNVPNATKTVNLMDYCRYLKGGSIDLSDILFEGVQVEDKNVSKHDVGETYFIVTGSIEHAKGLMETLANNFNNYFKQYSKNNRHIIFNYDFVN